MKKIISLFIILALVLVLFTSCSKANDEMMGGVAENAPTNTIDPEYSYSGEGTEGDTAKDEAEELRKMIKTYNLSLETKKFQDDCAFIASEAEKVGGYISSSTISGNSMSADHIGSKSARYTVRIPAESVDAYVRLLSERCNVTSSNLTTEDITESYYGIKAQLDSLVVQEQKLVEMLEKADSLYDMITLDDKLTSVRAQINELNYKLQNMDKSVHYSYVYVSLREVMEYQTEEKTYWQELGETIIGSSENFAYVVGRLVIVFVWIFPFILVIGIVAIVVILATRRSKQKREKKKDQSQDQ